jgi:putative phosphoribosyl transferase
MRYICREDAVNHPGEKIVAFSNRRDAGRALATRLERFSTEEVIVLALPRGGVPVGYEVAMRLGAPLDVFVVRKLGVPGFEELAMGAIASGGVRILNREIVATLRIPPDAIDAITEAEETELERRMLAYRGDTPPPVLAGRTVIIVDDGLATGASMRAALEAVRTLRPARTVVAVPVASKATCEELRELADEVICLSTPVPFGSVGAWYQDFSQTTDGEVSALLDAVRSARGDQRAAANA